MNQSDQSALRASLAAQFEETRRRTLALAAVVPETERCRQAHPYYSPFDWHLGHVGMTEAYWVLRRAGGLPAVHPDLEFIFANIPENPKDRRVALPSREEILDYLAAVRSEVLSYLAAADFHSPDPLLRDAYCFWFVLAHEWQHQETMVELLHFLENPGPIQPLSPGRQDPARGADPGREILIPAGEFRMGCDDLHAYDNERPAHRARTEAFAIDQTPVTVAGFTAFVEDGGYHRREFWTDSGWAWVVSARPNGPEHSTRGPWGPRSPEPREPVCGVNWYEASAFARWAGKRLPTEAEWERAAAWDAATNQSRLYPWGDEAPDPNRADYDVSGWGPVPVGSFPRGRSAAGVLDMAGGVWEWTSSVFAPYRGFQSFPYDGYSLENFDGSHYVLKGGSWATRGPLLRCSFRNFYSREYRQGFLGFRCARSLAQ